VESSTRLLTPWTWAWDTSAVCRTRVSGPHCFLISFLVDQDPWKNAVADDDCVADEVYSFSALAWMF
jgi:hypothetical protein